MWIVPLGGRNSKKPKQETGLFDIILKPDRKGPLLHCYLP